MGKNTIIGAIVGLIAGLTIGFWGSNYLNRADNGESSPQSAPMASTVPNPDVSGQPAATRNGPMPDIQKTIEEAKANPKSPDAQIKAGDLYLEIQRFDEALEFYKKAAELNPDSFEANANIGQIYMGKKDFEKAGDHYAKALKLNGSDVGLRSDLGLTFYLREPPDMNRAIQEYKAALAIDPNHEPALQNLSVALKGQGQNDEYAAVLERLKKVNPNNPALKADKE